MTTSKQELIQLIGIYLKDYTWKIDDFYDKDDELLIIININDKDRQMYININDRIDVCIIHTNILYSHNVYVSL